MAEAICQDVVRILRKRKPSRKNLSKEEFVALKKLKDNKNVVILPTDKSNATIVMDIQDFDEKIQALLQDKTYRPIATDTTNYLEKLRRLKLNPAPTTKTNIEESYPERSTPNVRRSTRRELH